MAKHRLVRTYIVDGVATTMVQIVQICDGCLYEDRARLAKLILGKVKR